MGARDPGFAGVVLESLRSGVVAVDGNGAVALVNEAGARMLGCPAGSADALLGRPCEEAFAGQPTVARLLLETLAGRRPLSRAELCLEPGEAQLRLDRPDGGATLGFSLTALHDAQGGMCGAAMLFRDLAPIERSDERERLQERLAALGQMAAGLAHEIRNPLAGMEVLAGLLQRRLRDDPGSWELLDDLRGQLRQLSETVTSSLDFLRPFVLQREPVDPVVLVEEALERALQRAPRPAEVRRRFSVPLPKLQADRGLLGTALANLIVNACEAMADAEGAATGAGSGRLELAMHVASAPETATSVRVGGGVSHALHGAFPGGGPGAAESVREQSGRELRIEVTDTGPGVPAALRDKIFDPFFTTKERGSGIGLANVQKVVTGHGGALSLETSPAGSVFRLHLPLADDA